MKMYTRANGYENVHTGTCFCSGVGFFGKLLETSGFSIAHTAKPCYQNKLLWREKERREKVVAEKVGQRGQHEKERIEKVGLELRKG
jgi:hypothetical protein